MRHNSLKFILPVLFGFFIMGFCDVVGVATSYVQNQFDLSESVAGLIPSMTFLWFLLLAIPIALLMNRTGRRKMVIYGNIVTIIGMLIPFMSYTFAGCIVAFAFLGIGNTILQVALNPLLTNVVSGKELSSSLTAGQVIKAISSFSGPFIAAFAATYLGNWMWIFAIFAITSLLSAIWLGFTRIEETAFAHTSSFAEVFAVLKDRRIAMLFLAIVSIVGVDVGINTLAPKLLIERCGLAVEVAGYGSSVYFLCRVIGSLVSTFLLMRINDKSYYLIHFALAFVALASLFFLKGYYPILCAYGVAGYAFSSFFGILYSQALKQRPEKGNEISGLMITGVFGGAVVPPLMGVLTDAVGSQIGSLCVIMCFALYLLFCGFKLKKA